MAPAEPRPAAMAGHERRRKSAAERRAQRQRAEGRRAQSLAAQLVAITAHRGGRLTSVGIALLAALQGQAKGQMQASQAPDDEAAEDPEAAAQAAKVLAARATAAATAAAPSVATTTGDAATAAAAEPQDDAQAAAGGEQPGRRRRGKQAPVNPTGGECANGGVELDGEASDQGPASAEVKAPADQAEEKEKRATERALRAIADLRKAKDQLAKAEEEKAVAISALADAMEEARGGHHHGDEGVEDPFG